MTSKEFAIQTSVASILSFLFGELNPAINAIFIFFIINIFLGMINGIIKQNLSSKKFINGVFKGICISFMLIVGNQVDKIYHNGLGGVVNFRDIFLYFYSIYLFISIIENSAKIGLPIPRKIIMILEELKKENN